jgi:type II secretory pathway component HofQ
MKTLQAVLLMLVITLGHPLFGGDFQTERRSALIAKLKTLKLAKVQFTDVTIHEAIQYFTLKSREADPRGIGVNIVAKIPPDFITKTITLQIHDVPLEAALKYTADLAGLRLRVEAHAVLVTTITEHSEQMYTRVYNVPPYFLEAVGSRK